MQNSFDFQYMYLNYYPLLFKLSWGDDGNGALGVCICINTRAFGLALGDVYLKLLLCTATRFIYLFPSFVVRHY